MDRPSALDLAFFDLETERAPLHVGWTLRFGGEAPSLAALRRHLDGRLDSVPRFRSRLARGGFGVGDLHWVDDPVFDVARHVHAVRLPDPGGPGELRATAGALLSTPLPVDRPLWRLYLVDGPADGFALVGQAHHALVDGIAAIQVALLLFDGLAEMAAAAEGRAPASGPWVPRPAPGPAGVAARSAARRTLEAGRLARSLAGAVAGGQLPGAVRDAVRAADTARRPTAVTGLDRSVTAERLIAYAETSFEDAQAAGRRHGATVNDVLLAATSIALGEALRRRGERHDAAKVLVPVSVRDGDAADLGNRISFMSVELPVAEPDPVRVLKLVHARTQVAKTGGESRSIEHLAAAAELLPDAPRRAIVRRALQGAAFNAIVSNVPGPPMPLTLLGRPLRAIHPLVPIVEGHGLSIGAVSYQGRICLGLGADAAVVPDAVEIARDLERAFDALRAAPPRSPTPWTAKARTKREQARARLAERATRR